MNTPAIDLKTLYEQTTAYCNLIHTEFTELYRVEVYKQPSTPIYVFAYWSHITKKLVEISYKIKEN